LTRINLTAQDLARTRLAGRPGPLTEVLFCLSTLRSRPDLLFGGWRRTLPIHYGQWGRPLSHLVPFPFFVDLFTIVGSAPSAEEGLESLRHASGHLIQAEIEVAVAANARHGIRPERAWAPWVYDVPGPRREELVGWLRAAYESAVSPFWQRMLAYLDDEIAARSRVLAHGGVEGLLSTLHPALRWQHPVLEQAGGFGEHQLEGRGLLVTPSVFCRSPAVVCDGARPDAPWILFYPAVRDPLDAMRLWTTADRSDRALAHLLGATRARVLHTIGDGRTTTELARGAAISCAAASEHASVLREAGLITTRRTGASVLHTLTPLGQALIAGQTPAEQYAARP
jgi:DNA-binding transcriptional ArsR family regulator